MGYMIVDVPMIEFYTKKSQRDEMIVAKMIIKKNTKKSQRDEMIVDMIIPIPTKKNQKSVSSLQ